MSFGVSHTQKKERNRERISYLVKAKKKKEDDSGMKKEKYGHA